jgi:hypothetical protein
MIEEPKLRDGFFSWQPSPLDGEGHWKALVLMDVSLALEGRPIPLNRHELVPSSRLEVATEFKGLIPRQIGFHLPGIKG